MYCNGVTLKIVLILCIPLCIYYVLLLDDKNLSSYFFTEENIIGTSTQSSTDSIGTNIETANSQLPSAHISNNPDPVKISNCHIMVCSMGDLGNQIWEYMSLFVVWKRFSDSGYTPYVEQNMLENLKVFFPNLTIPGTRICSTTSQELIIPKHEPLEFYTSWFKNNDDDKCKNIYLDQYSSRYDEIIDYGLEKIRKELRFKPNLVNEVQYTLTEIKTNFNMINENVTFVGMHYRGNDYVHHLELNYGDYHPVLTDYKFYTKAMDYFKENYKNVIFILITIDMEWLLRNQDKITANANVVVNPNYMTQQNDRTHDLVLLCHCNHSIINYGTFGATAALFANGTTFVYDLKLPLDHRGSTLAMGLANKLKNWYMIT